jgi:drug/metabolite transporter (DMT)-like permease
MQMAADGFARGAGWTDRSLLQDLGLRATYIGWRFAAAGLLYAVLTVRSQKRYRPSELKGGVTAGLFFTAGNLLQMAGLRYALPSVSAVLTSMVVVFTPFLQYFILRRKVGSRTWQAVAIALVGIVVLSLPNPSAVAARTLTVAPPVPWLGEAATLVASMLFTAQVLTVDHFGKDADPARFTLLMFLTAAVLSIAAGAIIGAGALYAPSTLARLAGDAHFLSVSLAIVVVCSIGAFHLMNTAQPFVSPAVASVVYCLEPVFATVWSVVIGTESMTWLTLTGGGLVVVAMTRLARARSPS